jgi:peptidoglycan/xylan/chitin deacetylase (PgdA/CDA1 family)
MKFFIFFLVCFLSGCKNDEQSDLEISVHKNDGGLIIPNSIKVKKNTSVSFAIEPDDNFFVSSVSGCQGVYTDGLYKISKASKSCSINVHFKKSSYILIAMETQGGQITPNSLDVEYGMPAQFTITPENGYKVKLVSGCSGELIGNKYIIADVKEHCIVLPEFERITYVVSTEATGNGTLYPNMQIGDFEDALVFKSIPEDGYQLSSISGCNGNLEINNYKVSRLISDCKIVADFKPLVFNITTEIAQGGFFKPAYANVEFGQSQTFEIVIKNGFKLIDVSGCNGTLEGTKFQVTDISENCKIEAKIEKKGRLIVSFDDIYADDWLNNAQPVFDLYNMKAIYYINPTLLEQRGDKEYVDQLFEKGNIIGHHSCTHQFAVGYNGDFIKDEIMKCMDFFEGYNLKHFAYPYGWGPVGTTNELLKTFDTVRNFAVNWSEAAFDPTKAMSIDGLGRINWEVVWNALDKAKAEDLTLHLATHRVIEDCEIAQSGWSICIKELQSLLEYADSIGLELGPDSSW